MVILRARTIPSTCKRKEIVQYVLTRTKRNILAKGYKELRHWLDRKGHWTRLYEYYCRTILETSFKLKQLLDKRVLEGLKKKQPWEIIELSSNRQ